jgi:predicted membrane protein
MWFIPIVFFNMIHILWQFFITKRAIIFIAIITLITQQNPNDHQNINEQKLKCKSLKINNPSLKKP